MTQPRRVILFAGFCSNGEVPAADLILVAELARHGTIHLHYDNDAISEHSLGELQKYAASVSFGTHGQYDFGSWKRLIERIGWPEIESYDELVLVNDSFIALDRLDPLFESFSRSGAHFFSPIFLDEDYPGPSTLLDDYLHYHPYELRSSMFASFFWILRRELVAHHAFRRFIDSIGSVGSRILVSHSYERGFSRTVLRHRIPFATFVEKVHPYSSIYTDTAYLLAADGLPMIKKKAITPEYYPISFPESRKELLRSLAVPPFHDGVVEYIRSQIATRGRSR